MAKVMTRKNTSFEDWRAEATAELFKEDIDAQTIPHLRFLHAYECDEVPSHWAKNYADKQRRQANTAMTKKLND